AVVEIIGTGGRHHRNQWSTCPERVVDIIGIGGRLGSESVVDLLRNQWSICVGIRNLMKLAVEEHLKCSEYPRVGAVVARYGNVLSTGHRGEVKRRHAERVAIEKLRREDLVGATLYTTLEPCVEL